MKVRDAVEGDAPALAALTDAPPTVLRNVIHDRSVRLLVDDGDEGTWATDESDGTDDAADGEIHGFVSFDVRGGVVHVTQFGGDREACERLLAEPLRFARTEGLPVEALVGQGDEALQAALEDAGFDHLGQGPAFGGSPTDRYRFEHEA
jgi:hypothetical protein